ncbi:MAG TPA: glycosyltransferase family 2 protein [Candidatus Sulfomarinibacteraceae bacterium]|nr:glycosyltransferase family 2 protein [Candidatus Sulfomarinibacteraceae bacterium]
MDGTLNAESVDLSIIIVSWNVRQLLRHCLQSIAANRGDLRLQVIVVDSASADGTPDMVREQFSWVHLIACEDNVGFPRGNNIGLKEARGRYILLLNPDTRVLGNALTAMTHYLQAHPAVGVVGPQLLYADGEIQSSRRRFPTLLTAFFESTWLEPWAPRSVLNYYRVGELGADFIQDVDWVMGAALMTRQEIVQQVGPLDEAYFMYSEELDWCRRIRQAGWRVVYLPSAQVIHYEGKSSEQAVTARHINFQRAKLRYYRKYHGRLICTLLRLYLLLNYIWQLGLEAVKYLLGHRRALRRQRVRAYWDVLRSGLRPAGY